MPRFRFDNGASTDSALNLEPNQRAELRTRGRPVEMPELEEETGFEQMDAARIAGVWIPEDE